MSSFERSLALELPCVHRAVRIGRRVAESFARTDGMADEAIEKLMLVVSELLANAVDHGGGKAAMTEADLDADVRMTMRLVLEDGGWRLEIEDQGGGDQVEAHGLIESANVMDLEDERGRGLFLVREMVEDFDVRVGERGLVFFAAAKTALVRD